jgi:hypothetical protein
VTNTNNGYAIRQPNDSALVKISAGGKSVTVRGGDTGWALRWFAQQYHRNVEPIKTLYGYRSVAQNQALGPTAVKDSNHLSGTALDINGGRHPHEQGHVLHSGFDDSDVRAIHGILDALGGEVEWGGDTTARYRVGWRDFMHVEIRGTAVGLAKVVKKLKGGTVRVTVPVLNGRAADNDNAKTKILHRRKRGYKITYTSTTYHDGRLWLRTKYGTYYAAEFTSF